MNTFNDDHFILENQSTAIFLLTPLMEVIYFNPAAEMLLKVSQKRIETSLFNDLFASCDDTFIAEFAQILDTGHTYTQRECSFILLNNDHILVDSTVSKLERDEQTFLLVEMQTKDRLIRISREEQLHENQETAKILIRGLAHEIKNPLGGIRGAAQLLDSELNEEQSDYTKIIIEEADRLRDLVDRMLGTHKALVMAELNIHEILERVCSLIHAESGKRVRIIKDYDPSIPELMGDKSQLIQGFLNIAKNALQALSEQADRSEEATITIRTRTMRQFTIGHKRHRLVARIELIDNGPGIAKDFLQNIFYPMISGRAEGTGLGLSITQSIFTKHSGLVECESQPGHTNFIVYLPLELKT
jgi:two-component system nitrogen regulation sensor histidine kinase GlnL